MSETQTATITATNEKVANLLKNAVLVSVKLARYGLTRRVKEDILRTDAEKSRIKVSKRLLDDPSIDAISKIDTEIRQYVYGMTVPSFSDEGIYFLHSDLIEEMETQLRAYSARREELVAAAAANLPAIIAQAVSDLGELSNADEFPSSQEFIDAHAMTWRYLSFSVPDVLKEKGLYEAEGEKAAGAYADALSSITAHNRAAFREHLARMAERLDGTRENGKPKIFRDSMVLNFRDFLAKFPCRNLSGDNSLASLVAEADDLLTDVSAEELRTDEGLRENTRAGMEDIMARLDALPL
jgi:hypothetical protein